jgi:hypothetical protein
MFGILNYLFGLGPGGQAGSITQKMYRKVLVSILDPTLTCVYAHTQFWNSNTVKYTGKS